MGDVVPLPRARNGLETILWRYYIAAIDRFKAALPELNIEHMRSVVEAHDAYIAEFIKNGADK